MSWRETFEALAARADARGGTTTLHLQAEESDFVRFNHGQVRQPGSVRQGYLDVRRVVGRRHATHTITVGTSVADDLARLDEALDALDALVPDLPEDPHLLLDTTGARSESEAAGSLPEGEEAVAAVLDAAAAPSPVDLVGIWQSGTLFRGFASSFGHRHWFSAPSSVFDYSLVHDKDRAVKRTFATTRWSAAELAADVAAARVDLGHLARPAHRVEPGRYRAWLTPAALGEIWDLYGYGHLGAQAQESRSSALGRLVAGDVALDARVHLHDHVGSGLAPAFQGDGFPRDALIPLIEGGRAVGRFVSPRSAVEYGLRTNGADASEGFVALEMAAGELADADVLAALGTGVYVSNLWYLNHSDRNAARVTGMTRFATFWVEDGRIVAPLAVMRFDDSLYDLLGGRLLAIGARRALLPSTSTYGGRVAVSQLLPGVLIDGLTFTL